MTRTAGGAISAIVMGAVFGAANPVFAEDGAQRAAALLVKVAAAYKQAPALTDAITTQYKTARGVRSNETAVAFAANGDSRVTLDGFVYTTFGGRMFVHREGAPHKYYVTSGMKSFLANYRFITRRSNVACPPCMLRLGETMKEYVAAFGLGRNAQLEITGHSTVRRGGRSIHQVQFRDTRGATVRAFIDAESLLITGIEVLDGAMTINVRMNPQLYDELPDPIAFETADRNQVPTFPDLMRLSTGDPAPDFILETPDGETIALSDFKGRMVVLEFWATWCGPCRISLPKLQEYENWVQAEGMDVEVLAVDTLERVRGDEAKRQRVATFWKSLGYTMPTILDYDNKVARAYGVQGIPYLVVVGPDGTILRIDRGVNWRLVEHLQALTLETMPDASG